MNLQILKRNYQAFDPQILSAASKKLFFLTCSLAALTFSVSIGAKPTYASDAVCPKIDNVAARSDIPCSPGPGALDTYSFDSFYASIRVCAYNVAGTKPCHTVGRESVGERYTWYGSRDTTYYTGAVECGPVNFAEMPVRDVIKEDVCGF